MHNAYVCYKFCIRNHTVTPRVHKLWTLGYTFSILKINGICNQSIPFELYAAVKYQYVLIEAIDYQ